MDQQPSNKPKHPLSPIRHSMKRRAPFHDYSEPGLYMITLVVNRRLPCFGSLVMAPEPIVSLNPLGQAVATVVYSAHEYYSNVKVHKACIMPDHIHLIIGVKEPFPQTKDGKQGHLGYVVNGLKSGCRKAARRLYPGAETLLFEKGYHDRIIMRDRHFDVWVRYLDDNPRRLALKQKHPDFFTVLTDVDICTHPCQITGNRYLLDNPDKMAVIVHRSDNDIVYEEHRSHWLACGERGGVLVSASVAPREKEVMREAMNRGYNIILLRENGFPTPYKPSGEAFDACTQGHLLQVSPWGHHFDRRVISRDQCLFLNSLAKQIVCDTTWY